ncbi:MAG: hypothetical protein N3A65_02865, partial [candidate division WOR-3 bacterium]|nr:hypothetical protein [candidate division WOR-3 bacterium]
PYEDANGIYLQWIGTYPIWAVKFVFVNRTGYFLKRYYYYASEIEKYTIAIDSCRFLCRYRRNGLINDFTVENDYGFLAIPSFGLEIINFQGETPFLYGKLELPDSVRYIETFSNYAFLIGDSIFYIIDIIDKKEPRKLSEFKFAKKIQDFEVDGDFAFFLLESQSPDMAADFLILNIADKNAPRIVTHSCKDILSPVIMFTESDNYIYFLSEGNLLFIYEWKRENNLYAVSALSFPTSNNYLFIKEKSGLILSAGIVYLLNLTYPEAPCVSEMINLQGNFTYGAIDKNYIYVLSPQLNIIEIKEIPE